MVYGAWITPEGNYIPVKYECHAEEAYRIIRDKFNLSNDKVIYTHFSIYKIMYRLGYIRLVYSRNKEDYHLEFWKKHKPSKGQREYIRAASSFDEIYVYSHDSDY